MYRILVSIIYIERKKKLKFCDVFSLLQVDKPCVGNDSDDFSICREREQGFVGKLMDDFYFHAVCLVLEIGALKCLR